MGQGGRFVSFRSSFLSIGLGSSFLYTRMSRDELTALVVVSPIAGYTHIHKYDTRKHHTYTELTSIGYSLTPDRGWNARFAHSRRGIHFVSMIPTICGPRQTTSIAANSFPISATCRSDFPRQSDPRFAACTSVEGLRRPCRAVLSDLGPASVPVIGVLVSNID